MEIKEAPQQKQQRGLRRAYAFIRKRYMVMFISCLGIILSVVLFTAAGML